MMTDSARPERRPPTAGYVVAVGAVAAATAATLALGPFMERNLLVLLLAAVLATGLYGGAGPSLAAVGLAAIALATFFLPPFGSPRVDDGVDVARLGLFLALGSVIVAITFLLRRSREHVRAREEALRQREAQLTEARLQALGMQIHPHFLFNALNAVAACVRGGERRQAVEALEWLGQLFRLLLERFHVSESTVRSELELARPYLKLQELRLGDRLDVQIDVAPECLEARVPALILQPLVENAFRHGLEHQAGVARLRIEARRLGPTLRIEVVDNGPGPGTPAREAGGEAGGEAGVGLRNSRLRLRDWSNGTGTVRLAPGAGGGARAVMEMPFREEIAGVAEVPGVGGVAGVAPGDRDEHAAQGGGGGDETTRCGSAARPAPRHGVLPGAHRGVP